MKRKLLILISILILISGAVFGLTANDYFDQATTKYLLGNPQGALADLNRALDLDPAHTGAKQLLITIQSETKSVPAPEIVPAEKPAEKPIEKTSPAPVEEKKSAPLQPEKTIIRIIERHSPPIAPKTTIPSNVPISAEPLAQNAAQPASNLNLANLLIATTVGTLGLIVIFALIPYLIIKFKPHTLLSFNRSKVYCPICKTENMPKAEFCSRCGAKIKVWSNVSEKQKVWYKQHHWKKNPFTLNALPELFTGHADQVKWIIEKIHAKSGHVLVMGGIGIGKTTLLKWLELHLRDGVQTLYISRPPKQFNDLLKLIANHLKFKIKDSNDLTIYNIGNFIKKTKKGLVLLLDEAHEFDPDIERHLRTLGDLDEINFVIAGLPETAEKFKKEFPPIYDRIVAEIILKELTLAETKELIRKRISDAGGHEVEPFTDAAIERIYELSKGTPRSMLKTCDWAVTEAIREGHAKIDTPLMI